MKEAWGGVVPPVDGVGVPEGWEVPGFVVLFGVGEEFGVVGPVPGVPVPGVDCEFGLVLVPGVAVLAPGVAVLAPGVAVVAPGVAVDGVPVLPVDAP